MTRFPLSTEEFQCPNVIYGVPGSCSGTIIDLIEPAAVYTVILPRVVALTLLLPLISPDVIAAC